MWPQPKETLNKCRGQVLQPRFCVQRSPESMKILAESGRFPGGSRGPSTSWLLRFAYQPLRSGRQDGGAEHLIRVSLAGCGKTTARPKMLSSFRDCCDQVESFGCIRCGPKILFQPSRHRLALA